MADQQQPPPSDATTAVVVTAPGAASTVKVQLPTLGGSEVQAAKTIVVDKLADLIERAIEVEVGKATTGSTIRYDVPRPDIVAMAKDATDEAFGSILRTAGQRVKLAIANQLGTGTRPTEIGDVIAKQFAGASRMQARRTVRTLTRDLYNAAALNAWEALGVEKVIASDGHGGLTGKTDKTCLARNGKTYTITQARELRALHDPTVHPNCTLSFRPVIPEGGLNPTSGGGITLALAIGQAWEPDMHPRWPKGTPGVDAHGNHLAGEFLTLGNIIDALKGTITDSKDLSWIADGSQHIKSVVVSQPADAPNALDFSIALQPPHSPTLKKAAQVKLRLEGNLAKLDDPGKTGAFMQYLSQLDKGIDLPTARKQLAAQLKGGYGSYGKWAVKPTHTSKIGHAAFAQSIGAVPKAAAAGDLQPAAVEGITVSPAGKVSLPVKSLSSNTPHDPSIAIPESSPITPQQWLRFGKEDQERYAFLQDKFGAYNETKGKQLMAGISAAAGVKSAVSSMYSSHYGHSGQYSALNLKSINNQNLPPVPGHPSFQAACNDLLLRQEEVAQWDLYNRLKDPEIVLLHMGGSDIKNLQAQGKPIPGCFSWSFAPIGWAKPVGHVAAMSIRNITMHYYLRALGHTSYTHELEFSHRYDLAVNDPKKIVITDASHVAKAKHLFSSSLGPQPGAKFDDIVEAMGVDPVGGPLDPAKKYAKYPPVSAGDLHVGDKFVDVNFAEHKVKSIDSGTGFVTAYDGQTFPPQAQGKLLKSAPVDIGKLVDMKAEQFGMGQLVYEQQNGQWVPVAYKQSVPGFKTVEGSPQGAGVKFAGDGETYKTVASHPVEDLNPGDEFWVPDSQLKQKATVTGYGPNGTVTASNGSNYQGAQIVEVIPKPDSAFTEQPPQHFEAPPATAAPPAAGEPFGVYSIKAKYLKVGDVVTNKDGSKDLGMVAIKHDDGSAITYGGKVYKPTSTVNKKGPPKNVAPAAPVDVPQPGGTLTDEKGDVLTAETVQLGQLEPGDAFKIVTGGQVFNLLATDGSYHNTGTGDYGKLDDKTYGVYQVKELNSVSLPPKGWEKAPIGQIEYGNHVWVDGKVGSVYNGDGEHTSISFPDGSEQSYPVATIIDTEPGWTHGQDMGKTYLPVDAVAVQTMTPGEHIFDGSGVPIGQVVGEAESGGTTVYYYANAPDPGVKEIDSTTPVWAAIPSTTDPVGDPAFSPESGITPKKAADFQVGEHVFTPTGFASQGVVTGINGVGTVSVWNPDTQTTTHHNAQDLLYGKPAKDPEWQKFDGIQPTVSKASISSGLAVDMAVGTPVYNANGELVGVLDGPEGPGTQKLIYTSGKVAYVANGSVVWHVDASNPPSLQTVKASTLQEGDLFKWQGATYKVGVVHNDGSLNTAGGTPFSANEDVQVKKPDDPPPAPTVAGGKPKSIKAKYLKQNDYIANKKGEVQGVVVKNDPATQIVHWMTNDGQAKQYGYKSTIWKKGDGAPDPATPTNLAPKDSELLAAAPVKPTISSGPGNEPTLDPSYALEHAPPWSETTVTEPGTQMMDLPVGTIIYSSMNHDPFSVVTAQDADAGQTTWTDKSGDVHVDDSTNEAVGMHVDFVSAAQPATPAAPPSGGSVDHASGAPDYSHIAVTQAGSPHQGMLGTIIGHLQGGKAIVMPDGMTGSQDAVTLDPHTLVKVFNHPIPPEHNQFVPAEFQAGGTAVPAGSPDPAHVEKFHAAYDLVPTDQLESQPIGQLAPGTIVYSPRGAKDAFTGAQENGSTHLHWDGGEATIPNGAPVSVLKPQALPLHEAPQPGADIPGPANDVDTGDLHPDQVTPVEDASQLSIGDPVYWPDTGAFAGTVQDVSQDGTLVTVDNPANGMEYEEYEPTDLAVTAGHAAGDIPVISDDLPFGTMPEPSGPQGPVSAIPEGSTVWAHGNTYTVTQVSGYAGQATLEAQDGTEYTVANSTVVRYIPPAAAPSPSAPSTQDLGGIPVGTHVWTYGIGGEAGGKVQVFEVWAHMTDAQGNHTTILKDVKTGGTHTAGQDEQWPVGDGPSPIASANVQIGADVSQVQKALSDAAASVHATAPKNIKAKYLKPGDELVTKSGKHIGVVESVDSSGAHVALHNGETKTYSLKGSVYKISGQGVTAPPSASSGVDPADPKTWPIEGVFGQEPGTQVYDPVKGITGEIQPAMAYAPDAVPIKWPAPYNTEIVYPKSVQQDEGLESPTQYPTLHTPASEAAPITPPELPGPGAQGPAPTIQKVTAISQAAYDEGKSAGGTNDAKFVYDKDGSRWLVKRYAGNEDRVAAEAISNRIYDLLGVPVPKGGLVEINGKMAYAHKTVDGSPKHIHAPSKALGDGLVADAFLANHDVVGQNHDNIVWSADGTPYRIDFGGTLDWRAMGKKKDFGPNVAELYTILSTGQGKATMHVTQADKIAQTEHLVEALTPNVIAEIVDSSPLSAARKAEITKALIARRDWLEAWLAGAKP